MDHREAGRFWDGNAEAWTRLARQGYDVSRDLFNTPGFLDMLPDVNGLRGLDIGCGEGSNTRLVARCGASMTAIDISEKFVRYAAGEKGGPYEKRAGWVLCAQTAPTHAAPPKAPGPAAIDFLVASAVELPFRDETFDFATAFMSLMEFPETGQALAEAHRVLRPGGFLQFSITHPCFDTPHRRNLRNAEGRTYAIEVGDYFRYCDGEVLEWTFGAAPEEARAGLAKFKTPMFNRTLSEWVNLVVEARFTIERMGEPHPSDEVVRESPNVQDAQVVAYFLHVRVRKGAS